MRPWHVNEGLAPLIAEMDEEYPGIVIGTIGDVKHQEEVSDHNPNAYGRVNAADCMYGRSFTPTDGQIVISRILHDKRVKYIISNRRIWHPYTGWALYKGSDPHTNHFHLSVVDSAYLDTRPWNVKGREVQFQNVTGYLPTLLYGDQDPVGNANYVKRLQWNLRYLQDDVVVDGTYGPKTRDAVKQWLPSRDGLTVGPDQWEYMYGMRDHS